MLFRRVRHAGAFHTWLHLLPANSFYLKRTKLNLGFQSLQPVTQTHPRQLAKPCDEQAPALCVGQRVGLLGRVSTASLLLCASLTDPTGRGHCAQPAAGSIFVMYSGFLSTDLCTPPGLLVCSIPCVCLCGGAGISFMLWVMTQPSFALLLRLLQL